MDGNITIQYVEEGDQKLAKDWPAVFSSDDIEELEDGLELDPVDLNTREGTLYILESVNEKLRKVRSGFYGSDRLAKDWAENLRGIRETLKGLLAERFFSCPKCAKPHQSVRFTDEGEGEESGRTFYYCSDRCRTKH